MDRLPPQGFGRKDEEEQQQQLPSNLTTDVAIIYKDDLEEVVGW